ncbi:hypothetical protein Rhe02_07500 [Rhizocola hellebori]|uniref:Uncharacterized protein n=1 Tax=Rhizocola hellebori TaxID=1392758 RepID=A0A8J3VE15_9ACTN|nr:type I restriction-modification system subunit M/S [Rhizocola hellebori]GIH02683.1 hypothetical protein Rhe02_07500 [Rhizocola hellebori]
MAEQESILISRTDIARHAGVQRAAVTNWISRHADFPAPTRAGDSELFDALAVATWLDGRKIPASSLMDSEADGQDYGVRFRRSLGLVPVAKSMPVAPQRPSVDAGFWRLAELLRGEFTPDQYLAVVARLIYLQARHPSMWRELALQSWAAPNQHLLDEAWQQVVREEPGTTPFTSGSVRPDTLRSAIDVMDEIRHSTRGRPEVASQRPPSAELFVQLIEQHAKAQGHKSSEFFTPRAIVTLAIDLLSPSSSTSRIYDPFCRAGEFLDEAVAHMGARGFDYQQVTVHGQHANYGLCSLAQINLRLHGSDPTILTGYWWERENVPQQYDMVFANPPFNMSLPMGALLGRVWRYGEPPAHNGNFAWMQHVLASLRPGGQAAVVMPNNASIATNPRERAIRAAMVDDGVVECVIALPPRMFPGTGIPACLWLLGAPSVRPHEVLFIDASDLGVSSARGSRTFTEKEARKIVAVRKQWLQGEFVNIPSFARSVSHSEIQRHEYVLNPSSYVEPEEVGRNPSTAHTRVHELMRESLNLKRQIRDIAAQVADLTTFPSNELPETWPTIDLGLLCEMKAGPSGSQVRAENRLSNGVPVLLPKYLRGGHIVGDAPVTVSIEIAEKFADYRLEAGDVVCTRVGDLGRVARVDHEQEGWLLSTGLVRLRCGDDVLPSYLAHALASSAARRWIERNASGTVVPTIALRALARLPVAIPPIERQASIGNALDAIAEQARSHAKLAAVTGLLVSILGDSLVPGPERSTRTF